MKLFCLPYAGGGALAFRQMKARMPAHITVVPVCLPGRDQRFSEPLIDDMAVLVRHLAQQYLADNDAPFAIYGHSMGSLIGFELIRYLVRENMPLPVHFFAAARGAPALTGEYERFSEFDDERFITRIKAFGGISDQVIASPELMEIVMPILRNDFRLLDNYHYFQGTLLPVPITSFHGEQDHTVRSEWVRAWQYETAVSAQHFSVPGNHFFLADAASPMFNRVADILSVSVTAVA
ncbi:thioesterase II family protein, partial [Andreprevotia chitinilytica]|uniref:thioesterase II family protein n=1 Tax=Andreprevotia chitinilytica TaxID=396808 RepID=UPI0005505788